MRHSSQGAFETARSLGSAGNVHRACGHAANEQCSPARLLSAQPASGHGRLLQAGPGTTAWMPAKEPARSSGSSRLARLAEHAEHAGAAQAAALYTVDDAFDQCHFALFHPGKYILVLHALSCLPSLDPPSSKVKLQCLS